MIRFGEMLMEHGASAQFVRGLEAQLAAMPAQIAADAKQQRQRRGRLAARCRKLAALLDRDIDGRLLTIDELDEQPGPYRIRWAFGQIRNSPRPTLSRALVEAAEQFERTPSFLRPVKLPRDLVFAVADRLEERLAIVERGGGKVRHTRPLKTIAAISTVLCGKRITARQVGEFIKAAHCREKKATKHAI